MLNWASWRRFFTLRLLLAVLITLILYTTLPLFDLARLNSILTIPEIHYKPVGYGKHHDTILQLIRRAERQESAHLTIIQSQGTDATLLQEYADVLHMPPPPGFDKWLAFARKNDAMLSTLAYTQIYNDLEPFMSVKAAELRRRAHQLYYNEFIAMVTIRAGNITNYAPNWRSNAFVAMLTPIVSMLPDMDLPINLHDERRIVIPCGDRVEAIKQANARKALLGNTTVRDLGELVYRKKDGDAEHDVEWINRSHQSLMGEMKSACPPESIVNSNASVQSNETLFSFEDEIQSICDNPRLHDIHGPLLCPTSSQISPYLVPVFSECKLSINADILFPAGMYYIADDSDPRYAVTHDNSWNRKSDQIVWVGVNSGGSPPPDLVKNQVRQRFVTLFDPAKGLEIEVNEEAEFVRKLRDDSYVGFSSVINANDEERASLERDYKFVKKVDMNEYLNHKYLIDLDGQSFSGRFRPFLKSHSLPFKQTLYLEWWQARFRPWIHYIPIKTDFSNLFPLIRFFHSSPKEAKVIAERGRRDAQKYFRKSDMEVYLYRLLLEYARLLSDAIPQ